MNAGCDFDMRTREEEFINIQPIQAAGRLTPEAMKALIAYGDGYSTCDLCLKPFRLDFIKKPPIGDFYAELAKWLNMDVARVMPGARRAFQAVTLGLLDKGDIALMGALSHYSLGLAIESAKAEWREIPKNENNIITAEAAKEKIEAIKKDAGKLPKLLAMEHFDYQFGNEHEISEIIKVAHEYGIPVLYNGTYTVGVMPVDGKKLGADFVVGSGHKSMAAPAPTGVLATTKEWADKVFNTTTAQGDVSGRKFGIKEVQLLGCTVMGAPLVAMMASFPKVKERVKNWDEEIKKSKYFCDEFSKIEDNKILSETPRKHTLTKVQTMGFDKVAQTHKRRGFFLTQALKERGVVGPFPGATKDWKLNVYGLTWDQIEHTANAFTEIARENGLRVSE
ncbi:MAG: O-phospho-L-seryl-tRNA:Cys-tRNA synthase [Candidatus Altiarchaeota archaeon]|nr:O-phospho-L-seryl-tRNA:Cys-tRNA synthase [Candidatus Altiarchaeota archaeon]